MEVQVHLGFCLTHMAQALKYVYKRVSPKLSSLGPWGPNFLTVSHCGI